MITTILLILVLGWAFYSYWGNDKAPSVLEDESADKTTVLHSIIGIMHRHSITPSDIAREWEAATPEAISAAMPPAKKKKDIGEIAPRIFGYLGAVFVMAGIGVYIANFWDDMGSFARVALVLGTGLILNFIAIAFMRKGSYPRAIAPLVLAAAFMQMSGWFVYIYEYFPHGDDPQKAVLAVCAIMLLMQGGLYFYFRRTVVAFTALFFFYGFFQAALDMIGISAEWIALGLGGSLLAVASSIRQSSHAPLTTVAYFIGGIWFNGGLFELIDNLSNDAIAAVVTGISLMLLGYALSKVDERKLAGLAYFFGSIIFYLGLFERVRNTPFELLYFGAAIGLIYVCTILQSRAILFTSVCALLGYIGYYTAEYFVDSVGWPIALVLMGLAFFAVGMLAIKVKKRYLMSAA